MRTLVSKGPLPVGFEVYPDFQSYKGGIYRHVAATRQFGFDPLEVRVLGTRALGSRADEQAHKRRRSTQFFTQNIQFSHKTYSFHTKHIGFTQNTSASHKTHRLHTKHIGFIQNTHRFHTKHTAFTQKKLLSQKTHSFHTKHTAFTENTQLSQKTHSFHTKHIAFTENTQLSQKTHIVPESLGRRQLADTLIAVVVAVHRCGGCVASLWWLRCIAVVVAVHRCGGGGASLWWLRCIAVVVAVHRCGGGGASLWWWRCIAVVVAVHRCGGGAWAGCTGSMAAVAVKRVVSFVSSVFADRVLYFNLRPAGGLLRSLLRFFQIVQKRRRAAPPFLAHLIIHLFRTCCANFRPRSRKVRSPGHVK